MNYLRRGGWKILATLLAFTLLSTACGSGDGGSASPSTAPPRGLLGGEPDTDGNEGDGPFYGGTIEVALEAETTGWNPAADRFAVPSGFTVVYALYDPLVALNEEGDPVPFLAESFEHNDELTEWTFKLREGVEFHDGEPFNAESVKWAFDEVYNVPGAVTHAAIGANKISEVEVLDEYTVVYRLSEPNAALPDSLRRNLGIPISRAAYEEHGPEAYGRNPVGTGPFTFRQWTSDDRLIVDRNPNYWHSDADGNSLPYLESIVFRPIPDEDARFNTLSAGDVEVMVTMIGNTAQRVVGLVDERDFAANLSVGNYAGTSFFNVNQPPVDDIRIREALIRSGDRSEIQAILGDDALGIPNIETFFVPESRWFSEVAANAYIGIDGATDESLEIARGLIEAYQNDPDRSDGRNPGDPVSLTYSCQPDPTTLAIGQYYEQKWGEVGIEVELEYVEQVQLITNAVIGNFDVTCFRYGAGEGDPLTELQQFFDPASLMNFTNFTHPEIDDAIVQLRSTLDFDTRFEANETIGRIANENAIMIWSGPTPTTVVWQTHVHGITSWLLPDGEPGWGTSAGQINFSQVYLQN